MIGKSIFIIRGEFPHQPLISQENYWSMVVGNLHGKCMNNSRQQTKFIDQKFNLNTRGDPTVTSDILFSCITKGEIR